MSDLTTLVDGLAFAEGPRWHEGSLWFSDMHAGVVLRCDVTSGAIEEVARVEKQPSGLGWDAEGRLLVVSMVDRRLLRVGAAGRLEEVADLSGLAAFHCNDMVVDAAGRAYIGNFGFDFRAGAAPVGAVLARVDPDGSVSVAAEGLMFPNGTVISPDGRTLIIGETFAARLTAFDIAPDGSLSGRRLWAQMPPGAVPDGICLDAEGAVWVASPTSKDVIRVAEGGEVLARIDTGRDAYACMLGGAEDRTLFICTAVSSDPAVVTAERSGRIEVIDVEVGRAGRP
ncbi:MAG TPA: SMP-30/gluconolactonase/LRE family protein [Acidimicrobiales bacterium]|nr:SMP-30/gluconolactonase/LRE family protein [Acidimicrobiales bacterium]